MTVTTVSSGIISSFITLGAFDELDVLSGGTALDTTINAEGDLFVQAGGAARFVTVDSGGGAFFGGSAQGVLVGDDGMAIVISGGSTALTGVASGGAEYVSGFADGSELALGGRETVFSGGIAFATAIAGGQLVSRGGVTDNAVVMSGGFEAVFAGGSSSSATVESGGTVLLLPGGVLTNVTLAPGGSIVATGVVVISPGGISEYPSPADDLLIGPRDSAFVLAAGVTSDMQVTSGGVGFVYAGGIASAATIAGGGALTISGGTAYATTVSGRNLLSHSYQNVASGGVASFTVVDSGGAENVSGGSADRTTLNSGGAQFVQSGSATATVINDGGYQFVGAQGVAMSSTVSGGGSENVSGGTAYATNVENFGLETAGFGGLLSGSTVASGGAEYLTPAGSAIDTSLQDGAMQVLRGGTATGTMVDSGAREIVSGNSLYPSAVSETVDTTIAAGGVEIVSAKGEAIDTTIAGGVLEIGSGGLASGSIDFSGTAGILTLDSAQMPGAVISGFGAGDGIYLAAIGYSDGDSVSVAAPGVVVVNSGGIGYALDIAGAAVGNDDFQLTAFGGGVLLSENAPCFAVGTQILTSRGEVTVEQLRVGDTVVTADGEDAPIVWIGRRRIDLRRHRLPALARPVRIAADAFDVGVPCRDLFLSPDHAVFYERCLIPAKVLMNGVSVTQMDVPAVIYYHVELAAHAVIFAEGLAVESYLETGNRAAFDNGAGALTLHPDFAQTVREEKSCAPLVEHGPVVEAARRRLWRHAAVMQSGLSGDKIDKGAQWRRQVAAAVIV